MAGRLEVLASAFGIGICGSGMIPDYMVIWRCFLFGRVFSVGRSPFEGAFFGVWMAGWLEYTVNREYRSLSLTF